MSTLRVVEIKITDKEITIIRVPEDMENTFCTGIKEIYTLSENVKINIERKNKEEALKCSEKTIPHYQ